MKKVTFYTKDNIDNDSASVIRLKHIVNGFSDNGYTTNIISCYSKRRFIKLINYIYIYFNSLFSRGDAFIYGEMLFPRLLGCFIMKQHVFAERTEYPFYEITPMRFHKRLLSKMYKFTLSGVDTFITCSSALESYYQPFLRKGKIVVVPFFVKESFIYSKPDSKDERQICYCGYMGNNKDGVEDLLKIFSICCSRDSCSKCHLVLLGSGEKNAMDRLKRIVQELGIEDRVTFRGQVSHNEVIKTIHNSGLLILTRPDNLQAKGGFPSKVGEYLCTGNPVLCTDVGEIKNIVGENIIQFVKAGDLDASADMIENIYNNYSSYKYQARKGIDFVKDFTPKSVFSRILREIK